MLVVTPYYNKPPRAGCVAHFRAVAAATDKPVMLYNIPGRTASSTSSPTCSPSSREVDNIVAVKQANADMDQARRVIADGGARALRR